MRVLMAEDDPVSALLLHSTLKKWGHEPVVARDGYEALAVVEGEAPPEIAILDWMMPGHDGLEICRRARAQASTSGMYTILLTAKSRREDLVQGLGSGADDYVTKPFNQAELFARFQAGLRVIALQRKLASRASELEVALSQLHQMQQGLKLESLGQMASGIAHEINTPTQYIGDNLLFFQEAWEQVAPILDVASASPEVSYLLGEVPKALDDALLGIQRIGRTVRAMRDFSRSKAAQMIATDIHQMIDTTLEVSTSEWKYVSDVEKDFDVQLPPVLCLPGEIHQVLFHLIVNAAHAMADTKALTGMTGTLRIATRSTGDSIEVEVSDTGTGIAMEYREKIFDPFFTTKGVDKGSGQGLATVYAVIVQQHNGKIWFETEVGKGTTFFVRLPVDGPGKESK